MKIKNTLKKSLWTITLLTLIFSTSSAFPQAPSRISQLLPPETAILVYFRNFKDPWQQFKQGELHQRLERLKVIRDLWESSEIASLFKAMDQFREMTGITLTEENLLSLMGEEVCLVILNPSSPSEGSEASRSLQTTTQGLIILKVSPLLNLLTRVTGPLMSLLGGPESTSEEFEGVTIRQFPAFSLAIVGNYAFLSDKKEIIRQEINLALGKQAQTLDGEVIFREIGGDLEGDYHGFVYYKIPIGREERSLGGRLRNLLLNDLEAIAARIKFKDSSEGSKSPIQITWKALYTEQGRKKGLKKFQEIPPGKLKSLNLVPADAVFYLASPRFSAPLYYNYFLKNWFNSPEELVTHGKFLNKIETALKLDSSKEKSSLSLGNEIALAGMGVGFNEAQLYLKLMGLFQVFPREEALKFGEHLFEYLFGQPLSTLQKRDVEVHYAGTYIEKKEQTTPQGPNEENQGEMESSENLESSGQEKPVASINPGYAYLSGYLTVARDLDTFESIVKTEGKLSENRHLQALLARENDPHWIFFINTQRLMEALGNYIQYLAQLKSYYVYQDAKARLIPLTEELKTLGDIQGWLTFGERMVEGELELTE